MHKHTLAIILRTSMNIHNMYAKRPFGLNRKTMVLKALKSLLISCAKSKNKIILHIVDDSSPEEIRKEFTSLAERYKVRYQLHKISVKSNYKSFEYACNIAEKAKEDILYFAEDDYVYISDAISFVLNAYDEKCVGTDKFAVHPSDYPDRYEKMYPSYIFLSKDCHWRSIGHTTGDFFINKSLFIKNKEYFYSFAKSMVEESSISKLWSRIPLISPIPSLAAHLNEGTIPPFINWKELLGTL